MEIAATLKVVVTGSTVDVVVTVPAADGAGDIEVFRVPATADVLAAVTAG